jgi:cell division protein FtsA
MADRIITGLDIGSTAVRVAVGHVLPPEAADRVHVIAAIEVRSAGVSRGAIVSIEEAVTAASTAIEQAERTVGVSIDSAVVGVSGSGIISQSSHGVIGVSRADGEIREEDVERAVDAARMVPTPANYEIIHVLPRSFTVDGTAGVRDPVGMTGIRLDVEAQIIQGLSSHIKNLTKCVHRTGIEIDNLVLGALAAAEATTAARSRDLGVASVNIGAATTSVIVYEGGDVLHVAVIPVGSEHITSDIAIGLRTSLDVAERAKLEYGSAAAKDIPKREEIDLFDLGAAESEKISKKYLCEIIEARVEEICEKIDRELKKIDRSGMLPAGVVFTGGGAKLQGIAEVGKRILRLPCTVGYPIGISTITDKASDASFATAVGLLLWSAESRAASGDGSGLASKMPNFGSIGKTLKKALKSFLP